MSLSHLTAVGAFPWALSALYDWQQQNENTNHGERACPRTNGPDSCGDVIKTRAGRRYDGSQQQSTLRYFDSVSVESVGQCCTGTALESLPNAASSRPLNYNQPQQGNKLKHAMERVCFSIFEQSKNQHQSASLSPRLPSYLIFASAKLRTAWLASVGIYSAACSYQHRRKAHNSHTNANAAAQRNHRTAGVQTLAVLLADVRGVGNLPSRAQARHCERSEAWLIRTFMGHWWANGTASVALL